MHKEKNLKKIVLPNIQCLANNSLAKYVYTEEILTNAFFISIVNIYSQNKTATLQNIEGIAL